jgi:protein-S-isoprenylcysteine O-methyltransferase Ste14
LDSSRRGGVGVRRRFADLLLFGVTSAELAVLLVLTPTFTITDWIYVLQHVSVLGIAVTRFPPSAQDRSLATAAAVAVSYMYPYGQVIYLRWMPGYPIWPESGLILVTFAAALSLVSILTLGRLFGIRPALRGLATTGPYRFIRHPMYLSYMIGDAGYNLQECNFGTAFIMLAGWASLIYRIRAEERVICAGGEWTRYAASVRYRLLPGLW